MWPSSSSAAGGALGFKECLCQSLIWLQTWAEAWSPSTQFSAHRLTPAPTHLFALPSLQPAPLASSSRTSPTVPAQSARCTRSRLLWVPPRVPARKAISGPRVIQPLCPAPVSERKGLLTPLPAARKRRRWLAPPPQTGSLWAFIEQSWGVAESGSFPCAPEGPGSNVGPDGVGR